MKTQFVVLALLAPAFAMAQANRGQVTDLSYSYAELRFVDVDDNGGDGFRLKGSYELDSNWLIVGGLTSLDFNGNVDSTTLEVGAGYVWPYSPDFDLVATAQFLHTEIDTPFGDADDNGIALSAGTRGLIAPQFEVRGSVNHVNLDDSDTFLELAGDFYFTRQFAAGVSLEFAGDNDVITVGARWFFR